MARFVTNGQHTLELPGEPVTFGASADAGVPVRVEFGLAPLHFSVSPMGSGHYLRDCESPTGTFVNGERVEGAVLKDGDVVLAGQLEMRYRHPLAECLTDESSRSVVATLGDRFHALGSDRKIAIVVAACLIFALAARRIITTEEDSVRAEPSAGFYDDGGPGLVEEVVQPRTPQGPTVVVVNRAVPGSGVEASPEEARGTSESDAEAGR